MQNLPQKIEAFRHEQAKELERLRAEIDGALRATLRYQEKQFDACLEVWNAIKDTQSKLLASISPLQQYSDIRRMDDEARSEYLSSFKLAKWQTDEILTAHDIQKSFKIMIDNQRYTKAVKAFSELDGITRSHELFFKPNTYKLVRSICDKIHSSLVSQDLPISRQDTNLSISAWTEYDKNCIPLIHQLVTDFRELINAK
jgi:hypothetical protein